MRHTYRFWKCSACLVRPCFFVTIDDMGTPHYCPMLGKYEDAGIPEWEEIKPQSTIRKIVRVINGR